jgi:hypothetical protein
MRKKQAGTSVFIFTAGLVLFASCVSAPAPSSSAPNNAGSVFFETPPALRPRWINRTPESDEFLYFTGMAEADSESEARNAAVRSGFAAAAGFYASLIRSETMDQSVFIENMGRTIADTTVYDDRTNSYTNAVISELTAMEHYTEAYRGTNARVSYKAWALCRVSREKAEEDISNFAETISGQYVRLLTTSYDTLVSALRSYSAVLSALEQNPLHRAAAYYDGPGGRVGLYEYCGVQINAIAGSVGFDALPPTAVQRGAPLACAVKLSSAMFPVIGTVPCRVVFVENRGAVPPAEYPLERNNSFALQASTARLDPGTYTVQLELLLSAFVPSLPQNPKGSFPLEVRPAVADIRFEGETLSQAEQRVLSQATQQALQTHKVPLLAGHEFLIAFTTRTSTDPLTGTNLLLCDISINLCSEGSVLVRSASGRITEISREQALKLAADYIRDNKDFWTGAAQLTNSK